jgi:hypothetical protein
VAIIHRQYTYRGRIKVTREALALVRAGKKRRTIRLGKAAIANDRIYLSDGGERVPVRILQVDTSRLYADLTDEDAIGDGFGSMQELTRELERFYGRLDPKQPMTVIHFEVIEGA